ncbi:DUF2780 domain-containing protein [Vibrio hippocampi]|uniref:DUF2780 domain-containing protein n=1 Tax=Vibrio hippocampi TaxID=654686 RepID=A0ABM8ZEA4_9VIBR|nr:DUF2780 domain-containing protein [Vibrio hippocampi]CAH0524520.1 hypothetical protein VHP8226_00357 [Vibrio hippocampi]
MLKTVTFISALSLSVSASAIDLSSFNSDSVNNLLSSAQSQQDSTPVIDNLVSGLSVSPQQATAGAGALLSLAQSSLGESQTSELSSLIPGMSTLTDSGLLSSVQNMESVQSAFSAVGLDPSMISQFAPIILQYLGTQGASSGLTDSLTSLWQ